jgi:2-hydroxychromene-2-carboxylate isomerase
MTMDPTIDLWFEFGSTYSYPAACRAEGVARARGFRIRFQPLLLGPLFRELGWNDSPFNLYPVKGRYMWRDLERICADEDLPLRRPSQFPRNGLRAARVACVEPDAAWLPEFVKRVYHANFAEDRDIADRAVVRDCLVGVVEDPDALLEASGAPEVKDRLRANTERAASLGIFGAPTFVVGKELFWGNDRLEQALKFASNERSTV